MEAEILKQVFNEWGLIYLLFFMIVGWAVLKGVPYIANKFDSMITNFTTTIKEQQEIFRDSLNKISNDFVIQIEKSNAWHESHSKELREIRDLLASKK